MPKKRKYRNEKEIDYLVRDKDNGIKSSVLLFEIGHGTMISYFGFEQYYSGNVRIFLRAGAIMPKKRKYRNEKEIDYLVRDKDNGIKSSVLLFEIGHIKICVAGDNDAFKPKKKNQLPKSTRINKNVNQMFNGLRDSGIPLSGPGIKLMAHGIRHDLLEDPQLSPSDIDMYTKAQFGYSWLDYLNKTYGMRKLRVYGERASVPGNVWQLMEPIIAQIERLNLSINKIYSWDKLVYFTGHFQDILWLVKMTLEQVLKKIVKE